MKMYQKLFYYKKATYIPMSNQQNRFPKFKIVSTKNNIFYIVRIIYGIIMKSYLSYLRNKPLFVRTSLLIIRRNILIICILNGGTS